MRYGVSSSKDYLEGRVVIRDFQSTPPGRVLLVIARDNQHEAEQLAQKLCDLLNKELTNELGTI